MIFTVFRKISYYLVGVALSLGLWSCGNLEPQLSRDQYKNPLAVLIYMNADNDLGNAALSNIEAMERAENRSGVDILVYLDQAPGFVPDYPVLLRIINDPSEGIRSPIIKSWPEKNSSNPETIKSVLLFVESNFPAWDYGLILWSHGTGGLPTRIQPESFGLDSSAGNAETDIRQLGLALKNTGLTFIIFDACYMAEAEVAFELRNSAEYLIASQCEILSGGFPYEKTISTLRQFEPPMEMRDSLTSIANDYLACYQHNLLPIFKSATISVIDLSMMEPLAVSMRKLVAELSNYIEIKELTYLTSNVQRTSLKPEFVNIKIDLFDFVNSISLKYPGMEGISNFYSNFSKVVIFSGKTDKFMDILDLNKIHGLTMGAYVSDSNYLNYQANLSWVISSGLENWFR